MSRSPGRASLWRSLGATYPSRLRRYGCARWADVRARRAVSEVSLTQAQRVHMVGIGGSGMSALATLLLQMGKEVSGSELSCSSAVESLRAAGAIVFDEHAAANVGDAEYVIRSSAVGADNVEVAEAEWRGLPNKKLAEAVGELMAERSGIAVAGTHGKTTTTLLVAWLLDRGGLDPLALIGADTPALPPGARLGAGPMGVEAAGDGPPFLDASPGVANVTSVAAH